MKKALLLAALLTSVAAPAWAQVGTVAGRVTDARTGETLPGVNVVLEGTALGTATDIDGTFSFTAPPGDYNLLTTFVGYRRATRPVVVQSGQTTNVDIALEEDLLGLEEVFVVGYGTTSELARTGSVARVGEQELEDAVINSFEQVLQGRAAGVTVQTNNGKLGQGIQVRVRGAASVTAGNEPLYVIDGIPVTTDNLSTNDAQTNPLAQINPSDIASIEVLKDASASAIYGARASNGVVLITTKSGFNGKTQFNVDVRRSIDAAHQQGRSAQRRGVRRIAARSRRKLGSARPRATILRRRRGRHCSIFSRRAPTGATARSTPTGRTRRSRTAAATTWT